MNWCSEGEGVIADMSAELDTCGEMKIGGFVGRVLDETGKCMIKHNQ